MLQYGLSSQLSLSGHSFLIVLGGSGPVWNGRSSKLRFSGVLSLCMLFLISVCGSCSVGCKLRRSGVVTLG